MTLKAHILIIDDDANTLASLARAFRLAGHEATVCDNAARALDLAKAQRFDLRAHILIIDDDANTLASLARAFRLAGHEATVCDNAARALDLAKAQRFDLILSDVVMPGRDGISLLEDLKNVGVSSPAVMMSGQATIEMAVKATRLGAVDFLEKPISTDKLLLTVENAVRLTRPVG